MQEEIVRVGDREFQVLWSPDRLWINAPDGSVALRLSTRGIDLHNDVTTQMQGGHECLWCKHTPPTAADLAELRSRLRDAYGVELQERWLPAWAAPAVSV